jgi:hypothetical protein
MVGRTPLMLVIALLVKETNSTDKAGRTEDDGGGGANNHCLRGSSVSRGNRGVAISLSPLTFQKAGLAMRN